MTRHAEAQPDGLTARELIPALVAFAALLVLRGLAVYSNYFWEEDEISIAAGSAALVANNVGSLYRYTVQLGYYRLVEGLDLLLGGNLALIPFIMKGLSAFAGALIPVLGFFAFRKELTTRERWLVVLTLTVNPILWKSSQYGNTAMAAAGIATLALVILSNQPARALQAVALALFGMATLVRADTVLLAPMVFFLLLRSEGSLTRALAWSAGLGVLMLGVYAAIFAVDPRIDNAVGSVSRHMLNAENETRFWEYLLWSISPLPLIFAVWGMRSLLDSRPRLLVLLLLWALPTLLFYFRATTTTRYFVNVAFPLGIAVAVGMVDMASRLRVWLRAPLAWALVIGLTTVHLFVALGHFRPDKLGYPLYGATIYTHDGPMPTGALLYLSYHDDHSVAQALPHLPFATLTTQHWEGPSFTKAAERLADPAAPRRTVIVLLAAGWNHAFHYHVQVAGADYISRVASEAPWASEAWMDVGNSRVMTIADWSDDYKRLPAFKVAAGDQIWVLSREPFPDSTALSKMPPSLSLVPAESFDRQFRVFDVTGTGAMRP